MLKNYLALACTIATLSLAQRHTTRGCADRRLALRTLILQSPTKHINATQFPSPPTRPSHGHERDVLAGDWQPAVARRESIEPKIGNVQIEAFIVKQVLHVPHAKRLVDAVAVGCVEYLLPQERRHAIDNTVVLPPFLAVTVTAYRVAPADAGQRAAAAGDRRESEARAAATRAGGGADRRWRGVHGADAECAHRAIDDPQRASSGGGAPTPAPRPSPHPLRRRPRAGWAVAVAESAASSCKHNEF